MDIDTLVKVLKAVLLMSVMAFIYSIFKLDYVAGLFAAIAAFLFYINIKDIENEK